MNIINSSIYAVAGGQGSGTIPFCAAIGGSGQSISDNILSFGNLFAKDSNITVISGGYGAAIGGGYHQTVDNMIFINCKILAVSDLNRSISFFHSKSKSVHLQNNPRAGIGTGGSQYYPPIKRMMNVNGNITFINCSCFEVYGGSVEKHANSNIVRWHSGSGIGLGGSGRTQGRIQT